MMNQGKLKQRIRNLNKEKKVPYEVLYQNFFFERFLERLSKSVYLPKFILKGGFLLSSLLGIENRSTADIDMTLEDIEMEESNLRRILDEIFNIDLEDNVSFIITKVSIIMNDEKYSGLRITILGRFNQLKQHFHLDFSTGDIIIPGANKEFISLNIIEKKIELMCYSYETVLSEKIETILSRGEASTRAKDYYDVYLISQISGTEINVKLFKTAFLSTLAYRQTEYLMNGISERNKEIGNSKILKQRWIEYKNNNSFVGEISYFDVCKELGKMIEKIIKK
ncbi:MAG: nucleotidyl transferase AbiEii/AbiGii toxin family protein [Candidatus Izemoplasma sp.]